MSSPPQPQPLSDRDRFPGLLPVEVAILRPWLAKHEKEYDRFDFNVRVGAGFDPGPTWDVATRGMAVANSQKRIDAVGYQGTQPTIIEVKERAGTSALGALLTYAHLFAMQFRGLAAPKLLLVTNRLQPDMEGPLRAVGIAVELVPTA